MGPITYSFDALLEHKKRGVPDEALLNLRREADEILASATVKVTDRRLKAPSGNPHEYTSIGIYWWPDETKPDGLPYVRRDGYVNPDTQDKASLGTVVNRTHILALSALYFEDKRYAEYAERQLYDWFINPDTYMEPRAGYAQAIPGICEGRPIGLIDFAHNAPLFNGIGILEELKLISPEVTEGVRAWYIRFTDWMMTHEIGIGEDLTLNNHGAWYDAQILAAALFTDRPNLVKKILSTSYDRRFKTQIQPDGSMPHELARTKAMGYSIYTMMAFSVLANAAERHGFDKYWGRDLDVGDCLLKRSVDFLYPYAIGAEPFPYDELHPEDAAAKLAEIMLSVDKRFTGEGYRERAEKYLNQGLRARLEPTI
jgi:hypothetical protein